MTALTYSDHADVRLVLLMVLVCTCLLIYLKLIWNKRHLIMKSWNVPGPFAFPIIIDSAFTLISEKRVEKWKKNRRIIAPSFNQHVLSSFVEKFAEKSTIFANILSEKCGKELDLKKYVSRYTVDSACEGPKRLALVEHMMQSGQFTPLEIKEEILTFLIGATDTVTSTLGFLFAVLGMYPDIQQKVYEEVTQILGSDRLPQYSDLHEMTYTEMVIKETLRLFPPAWGFLRFISEDIDMGEFVIPKGANTFFALLFIHRIPKYWPDPLKFDPDRFLPEEIAKRHPFTYIPFAFGLRNCIGQKYGMMNLKVTLSTVIRKIRIQCEYKRIEDIHFQNDFILHFRDGAKVSVTLRK